MLSKLGINSSASSRPTMAQAIGEPDLVAGQEALRAGNIGQAIISFRLAMLDSESQADASNGLGIAYARLGRADLAERYFLQATELAPRGEKYAANLMRFYESDLAGVAQAKALRLQQAELATAEQLPSNKPTAISGTLQMATRGPIMVRTLGDNLEPDDTVQMAKNQARPARGVIQVIQRNPRPGSSAIAAVDKLAASRSNDKKEMIIGARSTGQYPVTMNFGEAKGMAQGAEPKVTESRVAIASRSKTIRPAYPIRLKLEANSQTR
jgi:tetratricopeptide (TPR) repeat protein